MVTDSWLWNDPDDSRRGEARGRNQGQTDTELISQAESLRAPASTSAARSFTLRAQRAPWPVKQRCVHCLSGQNGCTHARRHPSAP